MRVKAKPVLDSKLAIGYIRVSTDDQMLGPEAQLKAIELWCKREGVELVEVFEENGVCGASGVNMGDDGKFDIDQSRRSLMLAIDALVTRGCGILIAAKRDRIARDTMIVAMVERLVERNGATIRTADGTSDGNGPEALLMRGLIDLFAQYERAIIKSRTKAALAVKKSRNELVGSLPYGWSLVDGGKLVPNCQEQAVIVMAQGFRRSGMSLAAVGERLIVEGCIPRSGASSWHPEQIKRIVESKAMFSDGKMIKKIDA